LKPITDGSHRRSARLRRVPLVRWLALLLLLVGLAWAGLTTYRVGAAASRVLEDLDGLESLAAQTTQGPDAGQALQLLRTTHADLQALQAAAHPFLWLAPHLAWLPRYGPDIAAAPLLLDIALDIALDLTAAGQTVLEPLLPLMSASAEGNSEGAGGLLQEASLALAAARPQLLAAQAAVEEARAAREQLQAEGLTPRLRRWVERLDRYLPLADDGLSGALLLPDLMGVNGRRTYLVLVQNEDELRATGGFISGVAQVTVEGGDLLGVSFDDSYAVDDLSNPYPEPPAALRETMQTDLWLFRDSNWSPDFPSSARTAIQLYAIGRGVEANGVIALDQEAIRLLVGPLGPLTVADWPEVVTGDNVIQAAQQAWAPGEEITGEWWLHRKDFMAGLLEAALRRLRQEPEQIRVADLALAFLQSLRQKHLLIYLEDEEAATVLSQAGWDGALRATSGDSLLVVDSNVGFNKVNAVVEESLEYVVDLRDVAHPRAVLTLRHTHPVLEGEAPCRQEPRYGPTYEEMTRRCYWDYLRVYVPLGSRLTAATPHAIPGEALLSGRDSPAQVMSGPVEGGREVFGTFFLLPPGGTLETRLAYDLPRTVLEAGAEGMRYSLWVQKQPGTMALPLTVRILLPLDRQVIASRPAPARVVDGALEYALSLETDQVVELTF